MKKLIYAGIGSRQTPKRILAEMYVLGLLLAQNGCILRSGGAKGADQAFELGCRVAGGVSEIYLPWRQFENNPSKLYHISEKAYKLAEHYHPHWNNLSDGAKKLHARNVYQILGYDTYSLCDFVICWTKDCKASGGTGQALRIAEDHFIPIYNLYKEDTLMKIVKEFI